MLSWNNDDYEMCCLYPLSGRFDSVEKNPDHINKAMYIGMKVYCQDGKR